MYLPVINLIIYPDFAEGPQNPTLIIMINDDVSAVVWKWTFNVTKKLT
jgi:hypothetical protein